VVGEGGEVKERNNGLVLCSPLVDVCVVCPKLLEKWTKEIRRDFAGLRRMERFVDAKNLCARAGAGA
jgi:hypothetical protein